MIHGGGVRHHNIHGGTHGIRNLAVAGAVHAVAYHVPAAAAGQLVTDDFRDRVVRNICLHTSCGAVQHGGVVGEDGRTGGLVQNTLDDCHLIFAPLSVAGGKGVALPAEGQRFVAVDGIPAFVEVIAGNISGVEGVIRINLDTAQGVDDIHKTVKVYTEVIIHRNLIEHGKRIHADLYAVNPRVRQLVRYAVGDGQWYIVVTGRGQQKNLAGIGVDAGEDVYVAAAAGGEGGRPGVASADVNVDDRILVKVLNRGGGQFAGLLDGGFNVLCGKRADLGGKIGVTVKFLKQVQICVVQHQRVDFMVSQAVGQLGQSGVFGSPNGGSQLFVDPRNDGIGVFTVKSAENTEGITGGIGKSLRRVVGPHIDGNVGNLCFCSGNGFQRRLGLEQIDPGYGKNPNADQEPQASEDERDSFPEISGQGEGDQNCNHTGACRNKQIDACEHLRQREQIQKRACSGEQQQGQDDSGNWLRFF